MHLSLQKNRYYLSSEYCHSRRQNISPQKQCQSIQLPKIEKSMRVKTENNCNQQTTISKQLAQTLQINPQSLNLQLYDSLAKLSKLNIRLAPMKSIRYHGHIRMPTVHNDYHSAKTNAGYARNKYGGIYPK